MHRSSLLFAALAVAGLLIAAPAIAAVDLIVPEQGIELAAYGCDTPSAEPGAYAIDMLFVESTDPALCEPGLLAATDLCLEPVRFDGKSGPGPVLDIRRLDCAPPERSTPG